AEKSVNAYHQLQDWGVQAIAGTVTTTPCIAVSAEANSDRVFMLTPSASAVAVTEGKDNVFQLCFADPNQGSASAQYIFDNKLATKVAIIYNNADAYSTGIYQTFKAKAAELGLEVVSETTFTDDTTDFSVQVGDAQSNGADLVFLPIYYTPASLILQQAASAGYEPKFFGVDGMDGILTIEGFDTSLAEGVMLLTPFSADATDDLTKNFVAKYNENYGEVPSQFAADGYDCAYAIKAALEFYAAKNGGLDVTDMSSADLCEILISVFTDPDFSADGVTGLGMVWDANGQVNKQPKAVVIKDGVYVGM
nr:ABC transporter substrate-binding protein [Lachnospiraceae bacterium]